MPGPSCAWRRVLPVLLLVTVFQTGGTGAPLVVAHRGASKAAPENTRSALLAAIERKAPVIEFDVRETSDGELVLFHDGSLERVGGRKGAVESSAWMDLAGLDVGKWFGDGSFEGETLILLEEALGICVEHGIVALVEHKSGSARNYASVIEKMNRPDLVIVQSFQWGFLQDFRREMPGIPLGALGSREFTGEQFSRIEKLKPQWVGWNHRDFRRQDLERLQEAGFQVALWTVNDPLDAAPWIESGVDAIITDVPDVILELVEEKTAER